MNLVRKTMHWVTGGVLMAHGMAFGGQRDAIDPRPAAAPITETEKKAMAKRPNILWLISDDTSHGMLGYAGGRVLSPNIDSLARNGVVFDNSFCVSPACCPSRYNCLTGRYGGRAASVRDGAKPGEPYNLFFNTSIDPASERTIGHLLQEAGYRTGHVGKWHTHASAADVAGIPPIARDADIRDPAVQAQMKAQQEYLCGVVRKAGFDYAQRVVWGNHESLPQAVRIHNLEWTTKGALDFIDGAIKEGRPFFLSMATTTIHGPNHAASLLSDPRLTGGGYADDQLGCQASRASIYERLSKPGGVGFNSTTAGVLWMDDALGAVLARLRALGIEDNTLIIFSTDHGPSDTNGGKFSVYEPGVRIPFCVQWRGRIAGGRRVQDLVQTTDFLPTILELAGVPRPGNLALDGNSFAPLLTGSARSSGRDELYFEFGHARSVRTQRWKYIAWRPPASLTGKGDMLSTHYGKPIKPDVTEPTLLTPTLHHHPGYFDPDQLYDLEKDPGEMRNLAGDPQHQAVLAEMKGRLRKHLESLGAPFPLEQPDPFFASPQCEKLKAAVRVRVARDWPLFVKDAEWIGFLADPKP